MIKPNSLAESSKETSQYELNRALFKMIMCLSIALVGFCQTESFVSLMHKPDLSAIRNSIATYRSFQQSQGVSYPEHGVVIEHFGEGMKPLVEAQKNAVLNDESLSAEFSQRFGVNFRNMDAVVIPSWELANIAPEDLGISNYGRQVASRSIGSPNILAFTLKNQPGQEAETTDSRPRVVLNPKAFQSEKTLRIALFHELLHAMNFPSNDPWPPTFAQNDFTYLSEYRSYERRAGLDGWREEFIWILAVCIPLMLAFGLAEKVLELD